MVLLRARARQHAQRCILSGAKRVGCLPVEMGAADFPAGSDGGYDVALSNGGSARCQVAVLAGGRGGGRAGLPLRRKYLDNNIGIAAVFLNSSFSVPAARHCWRRFRQGWFYLATLPNGSAVVVFVTLAKFVPPAREGRLTWWLSALATTRIVRELSADSASRKRSLFLTRELRTRIRAPGKTGSRR